MKNIVTLYHTDKTDTQEKSNPDIGDTITEPIRESIVLFVIKIASIIIFIDLVYTVFNFILLRTFFLNFDLPFNLHNQTAYILTLLHLAKTVLQVWGISAIVFRWAGNSYFITEKHLVRHEGIINCTEKIYDLNIVRSVSMQQSWFGKVFKYGSVNIEISASGGYTDKITLTGVANPQQYEKLLRRNF